MGVAANDDDAESLSERDRQELGHMQGMQQVSAAPVTSEPRIPADILWD
jgi:hypothetical protein